METPSTWKVPDRNELELMSFAKEIEDIEVRLALMKRRLRAVVTGDRTGNGPKVVTITKANGKTREIKCGVLKI